MISLISLMEGRDPRGLRVEILCHSSKSRTSNAGKVPRNELSHATRRNQSQCNCVAKTPFRSLCERFSSGTGAQFTKQRLDMKFHSVQRNAQSARDDLIAISVRNRSQHLDTATRQP